MIHLQEFDIEKGLVSILTQKFLDMNTFFSGIKIFNHLKLVNVIFNQI